MAKKRDSGEWRPTKKHANQIRLRNLSRALFFSESIAKVASGIESLVGEDEEVILRAQAVDHEIYALIDTLRSRIGWA